MRPILVVEKVTKTYPSKEKDARKVLEEISFSVEEGEIVTIIGPTGCGKTTLLRMIDGIVPPDSGEILLNDVPIRLGGDPRCALVFQNFNLFPWRNALSNIEFGLEPRIGSPAERKGIAERHLSMVGLSGYEKYHPHELSGGMQQRVGLARALAVEPSLVLFDEAFASLDQLKREQLHGEVLRILQEKKKTALFVTHDIDEAIYFSNRVISLSTHPARVKHIFDVDLPFPRNEETLQSEVAQRLIDSMREDLLESFKFSQGR